MKEVGEAPPVYEEDETPDYTLAPEDEAEEINKLLTLLDIDDYDKVNTKLISSKYLLVKINYLKDMLHKANHRRNQLKGYKASFTKKFNKGEITEEQKKLQHERIDRSSRALSNYIKHYQAKEKTLTGKGVRNQKKGGTISFFSNPTDLLQKLEVIVGSILAGNTNVGIRNTRVEILDFLLKEGVINKSQHERIFKKYFKP